MAGEPAARDLGIYFLDVGQGDCTVIVPPEGQGRGHLGAGKGIDRVYLGPDRPTRPGKNKQLRELVEQTCKWAKAKPLPELIVKDNWRDAEHPVTIAEYGDDWKVQLVLPMNYTRNEAAMRSGPHANMCSAVLRVERAGHALLIGGDAPLGSWEQLESNLLAAKAIRAPHHGGDIREGGVEWKQPGDLYDRVGAQLGVVSVGTNNPTRWSHPHEDHALAIRRGGGCHLLCTQLTPRCHDDPNALRAQAKRHATAVEYPYRHYDDPQQEREVKRRGQEVPCAGSVVAWFGSGGELHYEPGPRSAHLKLLQRVDHALCMRALDRS